MVALLIGTSGIAQRHGDGWVYTNTGLTGPEVGRISDGGVVTSVLPKGLLSSVTPSCILMDHDNVHCLLGRMSGGLFRMDLAGTIKKTILPTIHKITDVCIDGDGSYLVSVAAGLLKPAALLKIDVAGTVTTLCEGGPLSNPVSVCVDIRTGDYVVLDGALSGRLIRISPDGLSAKVFANLGLSIGNKCRQDLRTGEFLVSGLISPTQTIALARVTQGGVVTALLGLELNGQGVASLACDRVSDVTETVCVVTQGLLGCALYTVETATAKVGKVVDLGLQTAASLELLGCCELSSKRYTQGKWDLDLSVSADAGLEFVIAGSLTGTTAFRLSDNRCIALTPDLLTLLCIQGGLPSYLTGTHGWLDVKGRGSARLDVTPCPILVGSGVKIWFAGVTLDAKASLGIKTICDPIVICL